jgi:branched-chain amino acid transport system permease protein
METFIQSCVNGVLTGSLYAMIGVGLTVIFGVMRIINMAHGDMVMLGMYGAFWALTLTGMDPFISIIVWAPMGFLIGTVIYRFLLKKIMPGGELNTLLYTAGLSLFVANLALLIWSGDYRTIKLSYAAMPLRPFGIAVPIPLTIAFGLAVMITVALYWFMVKTNIGRAIRATSQEPEAAALMGVNVGRMSVITFGVGTALACSAGVLLAPSLYLYPTVGEILVAKCFVIVVLGGLGSVPGAIAGGILLGVVESLGAVYVSVPYKDAIGFVIFLLVLLFKPSGLFGVGKG